VEIGIIPYLSLAPYVMLKQQQKPKKEIAKFYVQKLTAS
jgi:hypothetical protein